MTIGIYGGSFDPIHTGHATVANFVSQCNIVDEVWLVVSRKNPLKDQGTEASDEARLEMAKLVADKCKKVKVCDIEMHRPSPSYTIDTLEELSRLYPEHNFKLIIGSDSLANFEKWKQCSDILSNYGLIVYPRPGYHLPETEKPGMVFLNGAPEYSMSSTLIREYIMSGWNINFFVPLAVSEYISKHKLYQ